MVGINLNGVIHGKELRAVAQEIFNKAKSQGSSPKADVLPQNISENPFSGSVLEFIPQETKTAKTGFEQNNMEIDQNLQDTVKSKAAIDLYSKFATKDSTEKFDGIFTDKLSDKDFGINASKKDKKGKNPFAFLKNLPKDQKTPLDEDQLRSIFDTFKN